MIHHAEHLPFLFTRQLVAGFMLLPPSAWAAAGNIAVKGSVVDDSGKPVANAGVLISYAAPADALRSTPPPVLTGRLAAAAKSDSNGDFSVSQLTPGEYIACAEGAPDLLDPCHWSASPTTFTVSGSQTVSGLKIVVAKGAVLSIHVNDPGGLLKSPSGVAGPVDFDLQLHIVTDRGLHHIVSITAQSANGRDYAITIPFDTPITLRILAAHFTVNDPTGNVFAPTGTTVSVPAGSTPAVIELTVTGKN
jgi:hypothetical protein